MAMKKGRQLDFSNAPQNLDHHPFFGLQLDEDQLKFANAIWSSDNDIMLANRIMLLMMNPILLRLESAG